MATVGDNPLDKKVEMTLWEKVCGFLSFLLFPITSDSGVKCAHGYRTLTFLIRATTSTTSMIAPMTHGENDTCMILGVDGKLLT